MIAAMCLAVIFSAGAYLLKQFGTLNVPADKS